MEDALPILDYLPTTCANKNEEKYIGFLWDSFVTNYDAGKFEFANLAFHLLYMSYVSFVVWRIRAARPADFESAMVGFQNEVENHLTGASSPFDFYEKLKESSIFRFIKLLGCDNQRVGTFSRFVKFRNRIAHPSGTTTFNDQAALDEHVRLVLIETECIQSHTPQLVTVIFKDFLCKNFDEETREWPDAKSEIEANLIHKQYLSSKDLAVCRNFDIASLEQNPVYEKIQMLFNEFCHHYPAEPE